MRTSFSKNFGTALAAFVACVPYARADEPVPMIRVTCVPEISLFQLETFGLYNIPKITKGLEASNGLYTLEDFVASAPFFYRIRPGDLRVDLLQYHLPGPRGECGGLEWAGLAFKLNGSEIDRLDDTQRGYPKFFGHKITATRYQLTHCRSDFDNFELTLVGPGSAGVETNCKKIRSPIDKRGAQSGGIPLLAPMGRIRRAGIVALHRFSDFDSFSDGEGVSPSGVPEPFHSGFELYVSFAP